MKSWLACAVAASICAVSGVAFAGNRLSTAEMVALSPPAANRQVQRDLLSVLRPTGQISSGMLIRLRGVDLVTHAVSTAFDGLCRRDSVSVLYAPADSNEGATRDQPLRPYGVEAHPEFHLSRLPDKERAGGGERVDLGDCGALDRDEQARWFTAKDAHEAVRGAQAVTMALALVKHGPAGILGCEKDCRRLVEEFGTFEHIRSIGSCPTVHEDEACFVINDWSSPVITVVARMGRDDLRPTAIVSFKAEEQLVVT